MLSCARTRFTGCYVATLSPFDTAGKLDAGAARAHAAWLLEQGAAGLCPAGTTGEFLYLSGKEKARLTAACVEASAGRAPVIAGVWALTVFEMQDLVRAAADSGAAAVFLPPPIYYPASDDAVHAWYAAARAASSLPVFAYNIPQYAANAISLECLEQMLQKGILVGVKDSTGKTERVGALVSRFGTRAVIFAASDSFAAEGRRLGADGFISAIANVFPALFARLWGGEDTLQTQVDTLRATLKQAGSIPALKYMASRLGFPFGEARLPFSRLTAAQEELLGSLLETA